jgi:hypothetical protein
LPLCGAPVDVGNRDQQRRAFGPERRNHGELIAKLVLDQRAQQGRTRKPRISIA